MVLDEILLRELAFEYDVPFNVVIEFYGKVKDVPCVFTQDEDSLRNCLALILQDILSNTFIKNSKNGSGKGRPKPKSEEEILCGALYEIYGDEAVPYLTDDFKKNSWGIEEDYQI